MEARIWTKVAWRWYSIPHSMSATGNTILIPVLGLVLVTPSVNEEAGVRRGWAQIESNGCESASLAVGEASPAMLPSPARPSPARCQ